MEYSWLGFCENNLVKLEINASYDAVCYTTYFIFLLSQGYASMEYSWLGFCDNDLVKLEINALMMLCVTCFYISSIFRLCLHGVLVAGIP